MLLPIKQLNRREDIPGIGILGYIIFENVAGSNAWLDERMKLTLAASMKGPAANLITDLDLQVNSDGTPRTYIQLKKAFTSRFVSPTEPQLARATFNSARQTDKENKGNNTPNVEHWLGVPILHELLRGTRILSLNSSWDLETGS